MRAPWKGQSILGTNNILVVIRRHCLKAGVTGDEPPPSECRRQQNIIPIKSPLSVDRTYTARASRASCLGCALFNSRAALQVVYCKTERRLPLDSIIIARCCESLGF